MNINSIISALADPTRLRIMRLLAEMELSVGELVQVLGQSQPRVSRHVGILHGSGLVERRREGSSIFLRQAIPARSARGLGSAVIRLLEAAESEDEAFSARCGEDRRHLTAVRRMREATAADYFARHAEEWDSFRALTDPANAIEPELLRTLGARSVGRVLDIGTGTGRIAEILADKAEYVVGLDKSPEMLRLARARLQNLNSRNWELVQGDFRTLPFPAASFDTIVLHQVLHYSHEPAAALFEAARVCRKGGLLIVVDLASHEREELRKRHAHVRLGFDDEQMLQWMSEGGFAPQPASALPGKELTTKIWTGIRLEMAMVEIA